MNSVKVKMPPIVTVFFVLICALIGLVIYGNASKKTTIDEKIWTEEELTGILLNCASNYKSNITFDTYLNPEKIDYDQIFHDIMASNTYIGCELFAFSYRYTYNGDGTFHVNLKLRDPALHRVVLTKLRVKQIARHLRGLSDYEKVKAVHDFIILSNEYSYTMSSAFNALYVGKSACNGYAFSFYAIMEELGVPVTCEYGGDHAWNKVCIDGEWYNIDLTWDDGGGRIVNYDYFLKSDADFRGHEHAGATAKVSLPVTGRSAQEYYRMIPNYRIILVIVILLLFGIYIAVMMLIRKKQKEAKPIQFKTIDHRDL